MKVAILAGSQSFSYNQGMHDFTIEEVSDIEEANEIGAEMSRDVIDSYACISSLIDFCLFKDVLIEAPDFFTFFALMETPVMAV